MFHRIASVEWDTLLFFFGVMTVRRGAGPVGYLSLMSHVLYGQIGATGANVLIGVLSAILDNIPLMFAVLTIEPDMSLGQWLLITLTTGVGGSLLSIGSAAGVALMGQARGIYTFRSHLRWAPAVAAGYAAGILAHLDAQRCLIQIADPDVRLSEPSGRWPHDSDVKQLDFVGAMASARAIPDRTPRLHMDDAAPDQATARSVQNLRRRIRITRGCHDTHAIAGDRLRKFIDCAALADPAVHAARPPIIGCDRVRPAAVTPVHSGEIGAAQSPVLTHVQPIAAAGIHRSSRRELHRPLWPFGIGTPHLRIGAMARLGAVHRVSHTVERAGPARRQGARLRCEVAARSDRQLAIKASPIVRLPRSRSRLHRRFPSRDDLETEFPARNEVACATWQPAQLRTSCVQLWSHSSIGQVLPRAPAARLRHTIRIPGKSARSAARRQGRSGRRPG